MSLNSLRVKAAWLFVVPFLLLSRPTTAALVSGAPLALAGLALRAWAAGTIRKDAQLATTGPYAHVRHPLYVGSFLLGLGVSLAGGYWSWSLAFVLVFVAAYMRLVRGESDRLSELFGEAYRDYAAHVPAVVPRISRYSAAGGGVEGGFRWNRYFEHREWEAALGAASAYVVLWARVLLGG